MSNRTNGAKRQKLSPTEGKTTGVFDQNYDTILELALPFLPFEDTFPNVSLASKATHQFCLGQLRQDCQKHHPVLLMLAESSNQNSANESTGSEENEEGNWLTYGRYRRFLRTEEESRLRMSPTEDATLEWLVDYEMILELSTLGDEPKVVYYGIQPLIYKGCQLGLESQFSAGFEVDMPRSSEESLRARVLMRRKSTGELANIMNQTDYKIKWEIDVQDENEYESAMGYFYLNEHKLPKSQDKIQATVVFPGLENYNGKLIVRYGRAPHERKLAAAVVFTRFNDFHPELLARAIDSWNWF